MNLYRMKKYLICILFLLFGGLAYADPVPAGRARAVAETFWQSSPLTRASSSDMHLVMDSRDAMPAVRSSSDVPAWYVFGDAEGTGFVVVSGDDAAMPVLGYSFENPFPGHDDLPPNLSGWLSFVTEEITAVRGAGETVPADVSEKWRTAAAGTPVVTIQTALWDQDAPYNILCPKIGSASTYTGCTATALAIVLRHYRWPESGTGTVPGYRTDSGSLDVPATRLGTYDWDNMIMDYRGGYTQAQANAVATLMRDCAVILQSDFGTVDSDGTGAYPETAVSALATYMGYDRSMRLVKRGFYSASEWNAMMKAELDGGNPVFYGGSSDSGGHAFVLDGYTDNGYFHVNWGWSGFCNGYFLLSALNPDGQGAGGSAGGYNSGQDALVGLKRDEGGEWETVLGFEAYEDAEDGMVYRGLSTDRTPERNVPFTLSGGLLYNMGAVTFTGDVIFAVTDADGNIVQRLFGGPVNEIEPNYGFCVSESVTITAPLYEGSRIQALYKSSGASAWNVARGNEESGCTWEIPLSASSNTVGESTRLVYNRNDGILRILVDSGVSVSLYAPDGSDLGFICEMNDGEVTVDASLIPAGRCRLVVKKDDETKELTLKLKD